MGHQTGQERDAGRAEAAVPAQAYQDAVRAFGGVAAALAAAEDLDTVFRVLARGACELLGIRRCSVYLRGEHGEHFHGQVLYDTQAGDGDDSYDERIKRIVAGTAADGFTDEIVRTRHAVQLHDVHDHSRPVRVTMETWGVQSMLGVPMVLGSDVRGLLFLDDGRSSRRYTVAEEEVAMTFANLAAAAILQATTTIELRQTVQTVTRQNHTLRRVSDIQGRLAERVLDGGGVHELAATVALLTGKPCLIFDRGHRRIADAMPAWAGDEEPPHLGREVLAHPEIAAAIAAFGPRGCGVLEPSRAAGLTHRCLVTQIGTAREPWGTLVVTEHGSRLGALDLHIARHAATTVALQLAAERRVALAEHDARAALVTELVAGPADLAATTRRAEYLGVDLRAPHAVCLVAGRGDGAERLSALDVTAMLGEADLDGAVLGANTADGVVLVLPLDRDAHPRDALAGARDRIAAALALLGAGDRLVAGLSTRCAGPADYERALREARQVAGCVRELAREQPGLVLTADDLGPGRLFLSAATYEEADRFARDALGPLLDGERESMAVLLQTLRTFFDHGRSVRRSAQALGVHDNTIRNRFARIEELTHLAVCSSSDDEITAQLAVLILRLRGWGSPAPTAVLAA